LILIYVHATHRAVRRIFGSKRDEVTGEWRKLHNEELNDLYFLPHTVWVMKLRIMRWARHVAHVGEGRGVYRVLVVNRVLVVKPE
jgi:hypothetical protein